MVIKHLSDLFHWLWPPIVQERLDYFKRYWNTHRVRKQVAKQMPSATSPGDLYTRPEDFGGERLSVPVHRELIADLRSQLSITREEAYRWVDDEFAADAEHVYTQLGCPPLTLQTGWKVFSQMSPILVAMYRD